MHTHTHTEEEKTEMCGRGRHAVLLFFLLSSFFLCGCVYVRLNNTHTLPAHILTYTPTHSHATQVWLTRDSSWSC